MNVLQKIYNGSPIFIQNVMTTVKGYLNNKQRYGKAYKKHLEFLKRFDTLSLDEKLNYQREELQRFIKYSAKHSLFYKNLYKDIDISSIKTIKDLEKLPIVEKESLRENIETLTVKTKKKQVTGYTGGTTGKSLSIIMTEEDLMKRMATLDFFKLKLGFVHRKMKRATFNGKHIVPPNQKKKIFWRYNSACKQMIYSSFNLTEENMEFYVKSLNKFKPKAVDGFFSSMCDVANYIERHDIELEFKPVAIFPTSETLTEEGRELLERVFGCKVYNQYASSEGAPFVYECQNQNLHIDLSSGVFENLENSDEILVTSFTSHATPLIRYRIGDRMIFEKESICSCGNNSPMVKSIEGRKLDFLYTSEGAKINAGNVSNILKYIPNAIIRSQFIQNTLKEITLFLEVDEKLYKSHYDSLIEKEFVQKFGKNTKLNIKHVKEIPREKSGKFRMIKNNVGDTFNKK